MLASDLGHGRAQVRHLTNTRMHNMLSCCSASMLFKCPTKPCTACSTPRLEMAPVKVEASTAEGKSEDVHGIVSKMMELLSETDGPVSTSMLQSATNADPAQVCASQATQASGCDRQTCLPDACRNISSIHVCRLLKLYSLL